MLQSKRLWGTLGILVRGGGRSSVPDCKRAVTGQSVGRAPWAEELSCSLWRGAFKDLTIFKSRPPTMWGLFAETWPRDIKRSSSVATYQSS
eukprot:3616803-Amphidinium_carterae.1